MDVTVGAAGNATAGAATSTREAVTFRRVDDRARPGSWAALMAILALVIILVFLIIEAVKEQRRHAAMRERLRDEQGGTSARADFDPDTDSAATREAPEAPGRIATAAADVDPARGTMFLTFPHFRQARAPEYGAVELLGTSGRAVLRDGADLEGSVARRRLSADGFANLVEYAEDAFDRGEHGLALAMTRRALRDGGENVPASWRRYAEQLLESRRRSGDAESGERLSEPVMMDSGGAGRVHAGADIRVEVDAGDHVMRVWRDASLLAEFPVGLGRDGATPRGTFRIGNKVSDPAWFAPDGRVVPAGDPGNPIGAQWMGLSGGPPANGIGIHPTRQESSIGAEVSLGCVRMRPEDAETLYRLAPVGTPVVIHD